MNSSTSYVDALRQRFHSNPVGSRVVLPDGSLAVVRSVDHSGSVARYKVAGVHANGRFRALVGLSCWYTADELRLHYWSASIRQVAS